MLMNAPFFIRFTKEQSVIKRRKKGTKCYTCLKSYAQRYNLSANTM